MKRRTKAILAILGTLVGLSFGAVFLVVKAGPGWVKSKIEARYPGVRVGWVDVKWLDRIADLHDVVVDRNNVHAILPLVHVEDRGGRYEVTIPGGTVEVTMSDTEASAGGLPDKAHVTATHLEVTAHAKGVDAVGHDVSVGDETICFASAEARHERGQASVGSGCVRRDRTEAWTDQVTVRFDLPFKIPGFEPHQTVVVQGLRIRPGDATVRFDQVDMGQESGTASLRVESGTVSWANEIGLEAQRITFHHEWVNAVPEQIEAIRIVAPKTILQGVGKVDVSFGAVQVQVDPENRGLTGSESCADWVRALPKPVPQALVGMEAHFTGDLSFEIHTRPTPKIGLKSSCKYDCKAEPIATLVALSKGGTVTYPTLDAKGNVTERTAGPQTAGWAPIRALPEIVPRAFMLLEDPSFLEHRGVLSQALENSLKINLDGGGFIRGGSTITMQTAKNLWLWRTKNIGRKVNEALLTYALESCLPKDRILEIYLNIVEYGPGLYGIGPAAQHYFHKSASELSPTEAFYLASLLPAPRKALPPAQGGLDKAKRLIRQLIRSGYLPDYLIADDAPLNTEGWETEN